MDDLRRNASWWVPWLLVSITTVAFTFTLQKRIGWSQLIESQIQSNPKAAAQMEKIAPAQRERILKLQESMASAISYATPVTTLLTLAIMAGVLLAIFNFGFGLKLRFGELMAVSAYSLLPSILNTLLIVVVMLSVKPQSFNVKYPIASSLGYFVSAGKPLLKALLGAFDVFTLWQILLLSVGVAQLSRLKVKTSVAFASIFTLCLLFRLAVGAMSAM
jgi:hypothetical protein